jgi:hypothetical protein
MEPPPPLASRIDDATVTAATYAVDAGPRQAFRLREEDEEFQHRGTENTEATERKTGNVTAPSTRGPISFSL